MRTAVAEALQRRFQWERQELQAQGGEITAPVVAIGDVVACSMERREGPEYDFNEPMLEAVVADPKLRSTGDGSSGDDPDLLVVAMLFLQPGKHAGEGGDIDEMIFPKQDATAAAAASTSTSAGHGAGLALAKTALLTPHPKVIALLAERTRQALAIPLQ